MTLRVELDQLLNLALGTPELGAVNFNILHGVLREVLNHLGIEKKAKDIGDDGHFRAAYALFKDRQETEGKVDSKDKTEKSISDKHGKIPLSGAAFVLPVSGSLESKLMKIEKKLEVLDDLPSNIEILQRAKQKKEGKTPVADMWQFININRRLGAAETGIEKLTSLMDRVMSEVSDVKEAAEEIDQIKKKISELENLNSSLSKRISALENVDNSEERKKMENLLKELENLKNQLGDLPTKDDLSNLDIYVKWPQLEEALNARRSRTPSAKSRVSTPKARTRTPPPSTPIPPHPSPDALEALRQIGELMDKHEDLSERVDVLEEQMPKKANLEDLEELRNRPDVPADILEQLKWLKDGIDAINKWKEEKTVPEDFESQLSSLREGISLLSNNRQQIETMADQLQGLKEVSDMLNYHNEKLQMIPDDLLDQLNKLRYLERAASQAKGFNDELPSRLQRLEDRLKEDTEREIRTLRDGIRLLNNQLDKLKKTNNPLPTVSHGRDKIKDAGALSALRNMLAELQGEQEKLNKTTQELIEEHNRKQKHIDALYTYADRLQELKADKEQVAMEIDVKANKRALDNLISRTKFDQSIGSLDQSLQELLQRLQGQELSLKDALDKLSSDIDEKLDRLELDALRDYLEKRIKNMKCKHVDMPLSDDPAAGFRKALLRFHCISCDRPVDMVPGHPNPALPQTPGLPPSRSGRPYTTFELDQIRQMHRGGYTYEQEVATTAARACGGSHTVTFPHRRTARFNQYYYSREDETPIPVPVRDETELIGQDGHIYKGRFDGSMDRMPDLQGSPRQNPKSPRSMSAKRATSPQPPRNGSPTNRRPRSAAVPTSPRSLEEEVEPPSVTVQ